MAAAVAFDPTPVRGGAEHAAALTVLKKHLANTQDEVDSTADGLLAERDPKDLGDESIEDTTKRMHQVRALANNPDQLMNVIASHIGDLHEHAPRAAQETATTLARATKYLADSAPAPSTPPSLLDPSPQPSKLDVQRWLSRERAVKDPLGALASGHDPELAWETVQAVYPATASQLQQGLAMSLGRTKDLTYQQSMQASRILGTPLHASQAPDALMTYQASYTTTPPAAPGNGAKGGVSKSAIGKSKAADRATTPLAAADQILEG